MMDGPLFASGLHEYRLGETLHGILVVVEFIATLEPIGEMSHTNFG